MRRKVALVGLLSVLSLSSPGRALAQDMDTFDPSGGLFDAQGTFQVHPATLGLDSAWYAGLGLYWAHSPLVVRYEGTERVDRIVKEQVGTRLVGGRVFGQRFRLDVDLPVYPVVITQQESRFALGDLQLGGTVPLRVLGKHSDKLALAVVPTLSLPTGSVDAQVSSGGFGLNLTGAVSGRVNAISWAGNLGFDLDRASTIKVASPDAPLATGSLETGSGLLFAGGAGWHLTESDIVGLELDGRLDLAGGFAGAHQNPVEAHVYGTHGTGKGLLFTGGLGTGLIAGPGAPSLRMFVGVNWRFPGDLDTDSDGIPNRIDACPNEPEDIDGFKDADGCPDDDNDSDRILDKNDRCPMEPEDYDEFQDSDGCPDPDNDNDTVLDKADLCPLVAGLPEAGGCPDRDKDRVPDFRDKCPDEPADPRVDPARSDGCPSRVFVTTERIEILDKVFFDTDKASIKSVSHALLQDVARVIKENPQIKKIEVQGHTDSTADDTYNMKLSQERVEAVVRFLVEKGGVESARLVPKGYGETRPIDTNLTEEGRAANRRVEFLILEQD